MAVDEVAAEERLGRAMLSLDGLSCGDAFGECFFRPGSEWYLRHRELPAGEWRFTDDTMMAMSVVEILRRHGEVREELLAEDFARRYEAGRGYGAAMHGLLREIGRRGGSAWREAAGALFGGRGSFGNGSAMRVAPVGAYFADDMTLAVREAERSAVTTHAHVEAVAGAVAVAAGAAVAWGSGLEGREFLEEVLRWVPRSEVRKGLERAMELPEGTTAVEAGERLGNGSQLSAIDTVPFALWCAGRWMGSYEEAMWQTVSAGGDVDTTCAMVGGVVVLRAGVPEEWVRRREGLGWPV